MQQSAGSEQQHGGMAVPAMSASATQVAVSKHKKQILTNKSAINRQHQQGASSSALNIRISNSAMNGEIMHHNEIKKINNKWTMMTMAISNTTGTAL